MLIIIGILIITLRKDSGHDTEDIFNVISFCLYLSNLYCQTNHTTGNYYSFHGSWYI